MSLVDVLVALTIATILVVSTATATITAVRSERHALATLERSRQLVALMHALDDDAADGDSVVVIHRGFAIERKGDRLATYRHDPLAGTLTVTRFGRPDLTLTDVATSPSPTVHATADRLTVIVHLGEGSRWAATARLGSAGR